MILAHDHGCLTLFTVLVWSLTCVNGDSCDLSKWNGDWLQAIVGIVKIDGSYFSTKGQCIRSSGSNYIFADSTHWKKFYRCLSIFEKHNNLLTYKESYIEGDATTDLCFHPGDSPLYYMVRVNATPIPCPWPGSFSVAYNAGHGECKTPESRLDSCMEDSSMSLKLAACPDVMETERTDEELTCLAAWKDGSLRFLLGQLRRNGAHANKSEDDHHCFVYQKFSPNVIQVAQSADATCSGLKSPFEGSRTMTLTKAHQTTCQYPDWMTSKSSWYFLNGGLETVVKITRNNTIRAFDAELKLESTITCILESERRENVAYYVADVRRGCDSFYQCLYFERRDNNTIVVKSGPRSTNERAVCELPFNLDTADEVILVDSIPKPETTTCSTTQLDQVKDETKALSTLALQRLVLLEHLSLIRMQKEALCKEEISKKPV